MDNLNPEYYEQIKKKTGRLFLWTECIEVTDGDTIRVKDLVIPFIRDGIIKEPKIRFKGINCYDERRAKTQEEKQKAIEATMVIKDRLTWEPVLLEINPSKPFGSFGRILAYVHHQGENISKYLLEAELATLYKR